jgi:hypothetical protein
MSASQIIHSLGCRLIGQVFLAVTARPGTLWILLRTLDGVGGHTSDAAAADTLSSNLNEVSGGGYARQSVTFTTGGGCTEAASGNSSLITLPAKTFTFTGTITGVTHMSAATSSDLSGVLVWSAPLATTRNFANGDSLTVTATVMFEQGS